MFQISNLTPDSFAPGASPVDAQRPRKRQRKVLSCDACHRQKVKCDRNQPCARCVAGNRADSCSYQSTNYFVTNGTTRKQSPPTSQQPSPVTSDGSTHSPRTSNQPINAVWKKGRARVSGLTHWAQLAFQFEEAAPFIRGDPRELTNLIAKMKRIKYLYPSKHLRVFPFGDAGTNPALIIHPRLAFLPRKDLAEQLVENYLQTFEVTHPLLDLNHFQREFYDFWQAPDNVSDAWLAQLYLMMALSCSASPEISFSGIPGGSTGLADRCIDGAETALTIKGQYMTKPDLTMLRALCMLGMGKRIDIITGDDSDGMWVFMGFVSRVAMSMSLHIGPEAFTAMPRAEAEARGRIWSTLLILEAAIALDSGMPLILRPDDYDESAISGFRNAESLQMDESNGTALLNSYQQMLAEALPLMSFCLNKLNSPHPRLGHDQITTYDCRIKHVLIKAQSLLPFQRNVIEIFLRRCLMSLHQFRALNRDSERPQLSEMSLRTVQESAVALLRTQQALSDRPSHRWLADYFLRDFGVVGLFVCVGLRNGTFDNDVSSPLSTDVAWMALKSEYHLLKTNVMRSRHFYKIYKGYAVLVAILEALEKRTSIREAVYHAVVEIISTVEAAAGASAANSIGELSELLPEPLAYPDPMPLSSMIPNGPSGQAIFGVDGVNFEFDDFITNFFW